MCAEGQYVSVDRDYRTRVLEIRIEGQPTGESSL